MPLLDESQERAKQKGKKGKNTASPKAEEQKRENPLTPQAIIIASLIHYVGKALII